MRLIFKILLFVIILGIALFFAGGLFYIFVIENEKFQEEFLIVAGVSVLGLLSSWFHFKTIKLYKLDKQDKVLPIPSKVFWTLNIGFAAALIGLFAYTFYTSFIRFGTQLSMDSPQLITVLIIFSIPIVIGGFIFFESYYLKLMLKKNKDRRLILEIDNIKGADEKS